MSADQQQTAEVAAPLASAQSQPLTYTVFATREGLVGGTTANGHVIQHQDHFVALPSRRVLSPKGSHQFSVRVCNPKTGKCETAPVWDVGPWNIHDDYWQDSPQREMWRDLPRGKPEAEAAYKDGFNKGRDGFGRKVTNPAGIDLADGTFAGIGMKANGYVQVTFLWTADGATLPIFRTWGNGVGIYKEATMDSQIVSTLSAPVSVEVKCQVHGQEVMAGGITNDAWSYLPGYGGYISNIHIADPAAWLPGVPTCS